MKKSFLDDKWFIFLFFLPPNMTIGIWSEKSAYTCNMLDLRIDLCLLDIYRLSIKVLTVMFVLPVVAMRVVMVMVGTKPLFKNVQGRSCVFL